MVLPPLRPFNEDQTVLKRQKVEDPVKLKSNRFNFRAEFLEAHGVDSGGRVVIILLSVLNDDKATPRIEAQSDRGQHRLRL